MVLVTAYLSASSNILYIPQGQKDHAHLSSSPRGSEMDETQNNSKNYLLNKCVAI